MRSNYPSTLKNKASNNPQLRTQNTCEESSGFVSIQSSSDNSIQNDVVLIFIDSAKNEILVNPCDSAKDNSPETISISSTKNMFEKDCPIIQDLKCDYIGKHTYQLTWTQPAGQLFSDNGRLSEYRISRTEIGSSKIQIFKTPEPSCENGRCTLNYYNQTSSEGYTWTIETRCSMNSFQKGNSTSCKPSKEINDAHDQMITSDDFGRRHNRKSVLAFWLIPSLFFSGVGALLLVLNNQYLLSRIVLIGIFIGCLFSIVFAFQGISEVRKNKATQRGIAISILAIIGSLIGIFLTIVVASL